MWCPSTFVDGHCCSWREGRVCCVRPLSATLFFGEPPGSMPSGLSVYLPPGAICSARPKTASWPQASRARAPQTVTAAPMTRTQLRQVRRHQAAYCEGTRNDDDAGDATSTSVVRLGGQVGRRLSAHSHRHSIRSRRRIIRQTRWWSKVCDSDGATFDLSASPRPVRAQRKDQRKNFKILLSFCKAEKFKFKFRFLQDFRAAASPSVSMKVPMFQRRRRRAPQCCRKGPLQRAFALQRAHLCPLEPKGGPKGGRCPPGGHHPTPPGRPRRSPRRSLPAGPARALCGHDPCGLRRAAAKYELKGVLRKRAAVLSR